MFPYRTPALFLTLIAILTAIIVVNLSNQWGFPDTRFPLNKGEKTKLGEAGAQQTFKIDRNGLSGINILFSGSQIDNGGTLSLALLDESCQETIVRQVLLARSLDTENSFRFSFASIADSKGKTFCLDIHFSPEKGSKKAAIFVIPNTIPEKSLSLFINGKARPNESLAFRPVYRSGNILTDLIELDQRISQYKPWFLKSAALAGIAILSVGFTFWFLILIAISPSKQKHKTKE
ncbi:MAG: hypothetical protein IPK84_00525 [Candidatus Moraniibacteriota bacterium]|nr:MAG: hypothetical protein IPK84_00525 [Candidatus Moranbacteria bacterium]